MVCFFLSLLKQKLPQGCPKQGGGVKATFGQCSKGSSFFSGSLPLVNQLLKTDILKVVVKGPVQH